MEVGDRVVIRRMHYTSISTGAGHKNVKGMHGTVIRIVERGYDSIVVELDININSTYTGTPCNGRERYCIQVAPWLLRKLVCKIPNRKRRITILKAIVNNLFYGIDTNKKGIYIKNKSKKVLQLNKSIIVFGGNKHDIFEVWDIGE